MTLEVNVTLDAGGGIVRPKDAAPEPARCP